MDSDPTLQTLMRHIEQAKSLKDELDSLMQLPRGYEAGDVLLEDESLLRAYQGGTKPVYSQMSVWNPKNWRTVYRAFNAKGAFEVQPFFTGTEMHSSMVDVYKNQIRKLHILSAYENKPIDFETSLTDICYRPNLLKQLSREGRIAVRQLFPDSPDEEIEQHLFNLYRELLLEHISENKEEYKLFVNDAEKAASAWLKDMLRKLPKRVEPVVTQAFQTVHQRKSRKGRASDIPELPSDEEQDVFVKVFCSEFTSRILVEAQKLLNSDLNARLQETNRRSETISFFNPIIPPSFPREAIHPARLKQFLIESGFSPTPPPLITRILLGNLDGPAPVTK